MDKNDIKNFLKQTEKIVKELGSKAGELAKAVEKDAQIGTKAGMVRVEQLALENDRNKLLNQLGVKSYALLKKRQIAHKTLESTYDKIVKIDNQIRSKKMIITKLKKRMGSGMPKPKKSTKKSAPKKK
jgi:hypothetical protein